MVSFKQKVYGATPLQSSPDTSSLPFRAVYFTADYFPPGTARRRRLSVQSPAFPATMRARADSVRPAGTPERLDRETP
jgi:hypothetical protein